MRILALGACALVFALAASMGAALAQDAVTITQAAPFDFWAWVEANVPGWGILALVGLYKALEAVGKAIPDDATGWRAVLRKIAKVVTFYIPNRVQA